MKQRLIKPKRKIINFAPPHEAEEKLKQEKTNREKRIRNKPIEELTLEEIQEIW